MTMKNPIDPIIRAAARTVRTHADLKRATVDGASEPAVKKYKAAFEQAIDELEKALEAFAKALSAKKPPSAPIDWMGALRAAQAIMKAATKVRRGAKVEDVIEGEIVE